MSLAMLLYLSLLVLLVALWMAHATQGVLSRILVGIFLALPAGVCTLVVLAPVLQNWPWVTMLVATLGLGLVPSKAKR